MFRSFMQSTMLYIRSFHLHGAEDISNVRMFSCNTCSNYYTSTARRVGLSSWQPGTLEVDLDFVSTMAHILWCF